MAREKTPILEKRLLFDYQIFANNIPPRNLQGGESCAALVTRTNQPAKEFVHKLMSAESLLLLQQRNIAELGKCSYMAVPFGTLALCQSLVSRFL